MNLFDKRAIITIRQDDLTNSLIILLILVNCMAVFDKDTTLVSGISVTLLKIFRYGITVTAFFVQFLRNRSINIYCVLPFIWWIITHFNSYENPGIGIVNLISLLTICIASDEEMHHVMKWFRYLMIVISSMSIICYISYITGGPIPYTVTDFYSITYGRRLGVYINYFTNYIWFNNTGFARSCGFFNEPGYFGTSLAFLLIMEKYNIKKKGNVILLLAGMITLSVGFIVISAIYLLLNSTKDFKKLVFVTSLMVIIVFVLPSIHINNDSINWLISRLSLIDGRLSGDNRTVIGYDNIFNNWKKSSEVWFGYGHGYSDYIQKAVNAGTASYKNYLLNYGIIGTIVSLGSLFALSFRKTLFDRDAIIYLIISFISLYQRPYAYNAFYFTFLFGGIAYIRYEKMRPDNDYVMAEDISVLNNDCSQQ